MLFENGLGLPHRRTVPVQFKKPKSEFDFTVEQRSTFEDPMPHPLGTFTVSELDPSRLAEEPVSLQLLLEVDGRLIVGARQGERKLAVRWSLYPPPRHDPEEKED